MTYNPESGSGRAAIYAFVSQMEAKHPSITVNDLVSCLALAEDKAHVYAIKDLPVPAGLKDDKPAGLMLHRRDGVN